MAFPNLFSHPFPSISFVLRFDVFVFLLKLQNEGKEGKIDFLLISPNASPPFVFKNFSLSFSSNRQPLPSLVSPYCFACFLSTARHSH